MKLLAAIAVLTIVLILLSGCVTQQAGEEGFEVGKATEVIAPAEEAPAEESPENREFFVVEYTKDPNLDGYSRKIVAGWPMRNVLPEEPRFAAGEFIVKLKTKISPRVSEGVVGVGVPTVDALNKKFKVRDSRLLFKTKQGVPSLSNIHVLKLPKTANIPQIVSEYKKDPNVVYAEPNYIYETTQGGGGGGGSSTVVPNDAGYSEQWAHQKIDSEQAWVIETGDPSIVIAIVDTGVDYMHEDLASNVWTNEDESEGDANGDGCPGTCGIDDDGDGLIDEDSQDRQPGDWWYSNDLVEDDDENGYIDDIKGWDFLNNDNDPFDDHGHGTHVAGIAAADTNNSIGVAGTCWYCRVMALKFLGADGYGVSGDAVEAIVYAADNGAKVINNSWGGGGYSKILEDAIDYAFSKGVFLVAAGGNNNIEGINYPSDHNNMFKVANTIQDDNRNWLSNYGSHTDIAAPGTSIFATVPSGSCFLCDSSGYRHLSGTSMAAPHVAGLAGLVLSKNPNLTPQQVGNIIKDGSDKFGIDIGKPDKYMGPGRINAYKTLLLDTASNSIADIISPKEGPPDKVHLTINIEGSASKPYTVYYGKGIYPDSFTEINSGATQTGVLATWDTLQAEEGLHTIKLETRDINGTSEDIVFVKVKNLEILEPMQDDIYRHGDILDINVKFYRPNNYVFEWGEGSNPTTWHTTGFATQRDGYDITGTWDTNVVPKHGESYNEYAIRLKEETTNYDDKTIIYLDQTLKVGWPKRFKWLPCSDYWACEYHYGYLAPVLEDLDDDGRVEIITYLRGNPSKIYVLDENGNNLPGWPVDADFGAYDETYYSPSAILTVGDLDNDVKKEVLFVSVNYNENSVPTLYLRAYDYNGNLLDGWPKEFSNRWPVSSSVVLSDLDFDGHLEIVLYLKPWTDMEYLGTTFLYVLDSYGNTLPNWPVKLSGNSYGAVDTTPAVGNLDDDEELEIVFAENIYNPNGDSNSTIYAFNLDSTKLFSTTFNAWIFSSPTLGDLDNDGDTEIVVGRYWLKQGNGGVVVIDNKGNIIPGWPKLEYSDIWTSAALLEFNGNDSLEIGIIQHLGHTFLYDYNGSEIWSKVSDFEVYSPVSGDMNGDGKPDISHNGWFHAYAWTFEGNAIKGYPKKVEDTYRATEVIGDIDKDGKVEAVANSDWPYDSKNEKSKRVSVMYVWEIDSNYDFTTMEWPMFQHDAQHTGLYRKLYSIDLAGDKWNLITLPERAFPRLTSYTLLRQNPGISSVQRYDYELDDYVSADRGDYTGEPIGEDFYLLPRAAYFIHTLDEPVEMFFRGDEIIKPIELNLLGGENNHVGIPYSPVQYTSYSFLQAIPSATMVCKWQDYGTVCAEKNPEGEIIGTDFAIGSDTGLIVQVSQNTNWMPGCNDMDSDGYYAPNENCMSDKIDCDDSNPNTNPQATEKCDNKLDDNCNGTVNEGCGQPKPKPVKPIIPDLGDIFGWLP